MPDDFLASLPPVGGSFTDFQSVPTYTLGGSEFVVNWGADGGPDLMPASQFFASAVSPWMPSFFTGGVADPFRSISNDIRPLPGVGDGVAASPFTSADGGAPAPQALAEARAAIDRMNFQVDDQTGELYLDGKPAGTAGETQRLLALMQASDTGDAVATQSLAKTVADKASGMWGSLSKETQGMLKSAAFMLALGGVGVALGQAVAGGDREIKLPDAPGPGPEQQAAQRAFSNVLTTGGATTGVPAGVAGLATPNLGAPFAATGQQNLEDVFRSGLAGQSILTQLAALQAARELGISTEQAPAEAAVRNLSMAQLPSFMTPPNAGPGALQMTQGADGTYTLAPAIAGLNQPPRIDDPIRAAFASEIARAVGGGTASPLLERAEREEEDQLRNRLFQQLGAGYEVSTPGMEALQRMRESQAIRREGNRQQTYASLGPQEFARRGAEYQVPLTAASNLTNIDLANRGFTSRERQTGLAERLGLLNLGRTPTPQIATTLGSNVPISPLLGLDSAERARQQQYAINTQAALQSFGADAQGDQALAGAIAGLFGSAAGSFRPQNTIVLGGAS